MLARLLLARQKQEQELSELVRQSNRFAYNEQDEAIQREARDCLREIYSLMCRCRPTKDSCHPRSFVENGKFDYLQYYARVELFIVQGNYCHATNELGNLEHYYGLLPARIYYPVIHLLKRV